MRKIYKYEVPEPSCFTQVSMFGVPKGTKVLCVGTQLVGTGDRQDERIYLWAEVDPHGPPVDALRLVIVATGEKVPLNAVYLGTVHFTTCRLVFHLYQLNDGDKEPQYEEEPPREVLEAQW